jgi:hypothetical protein
MEEEQEARLAKETAGAAEEAMGAWETATATAMEKAKAKAKAKAMAMAMASSDFFFFFFFFFCSSSSFIVVPGEGDDDVELICGVPFFCHRKENSAAVDKARRLLIGPPRPRHHIHFASRFCVLDRAFSSALQLALLSELVLLVGSETEIAWDDENRSPVILMPFRNAN